MIVTEIYETREDGNDLIRTYSNLGFKIMQNGTGAVYDEAIDPRFANRIYVETDELIDESEADEDTDAEDILDILLREKE